jgi:hypothetical protein
LLVLGSASSPGDLVLFLAGASIHLTRRWFRRYCSGCPNFGRRWCIELQGTQHMQLGASVTHGKPFQQLLAVRVLAGADPRHPIPSWCGDTLPQHRELLKTRDIISL